jgi:hypothetical protein
MTEEINLEQKQLDEKYYEVFLNLFTTEGWEQLKNEMIQNHNLLNNVQNVKSEEVNFVKGQLSILTNLINLEDSTKFALEQMETAENLDEDN